MAVGKNTIFKESLNWVFLASFELETVLGLQVWSSMPRDSILLSRT